MTDAPLTVVRSPAAAVRMDAAHRFVSTHAAAAECLLVGASRAAVDDFARDAAARLGAVFGLRRFGLRRLAAALAEPELARRRCAPAVGLGVEAVAARAAFEADKADALGYLAPAARDRSFARTLAATLRDLRRAGVDAAQLAGGGDGRGDLAALAARYDEQLAQARLVDDAGVLRMAADAARNGAAGHLLGGPLLLLDVAVRDEATRGLVAALAGRASRTLATAPAGDRRTLDALERLPGACVDEPEDAGAASPLGCVRRRLFTPAAADVPAEAADDAQAEVTFFSAPGEARECVEVARAILRESERGVPFDRMAILLRAPGVYGAPLETALGRADVPAWFARGTRAPDPAGRALVALLDCAAERLSARRFAEYLSLAQTPPLDADGAPPAGRRTWSPPANADEVLPIPPPPEAAEAPEAPPDAPPDADDRAEVAGALRAPRQWERLLVESAVIGGLDRWTRRLDGLARELEIRRGRYATDEPESPRLRGLDRNLRNLGHLRRFALPVIERLAALPHAASWAVWLDALDALAPMTLRRPDRVLAALGELRPMAQVGPVGLDEVRDVLAERLTALHADPPAHRYGRVFVGQPDDARGRLFDVVFVPGLAERVFPQKQRQDPLLLDDVRRALNDGISEGAVGLALQDDRASGERLLLQIAVGAAAERLRLSYPRLDAAEARPRVPSFYALDVERARVGRIPDFRRLERTAYDRAGARLAWPAPADPAAAIDDAEHDLAVLGPLLRGEAAGDVTGRARYLLKLNPGLRRSLLTRWARWRRPWSRYDGLYGLSPASLDALAAHRPARRPYSVSALQRFAACPYQFLLSAIHRLEPRERIEPLERLDPLTRGRMFHEAQAETVRALGRRQALPVTPARLAAAEEVVSATLDRVAARYREDLAPAIDRVWTDEVEAMRIDLKGWLRHVADEGGAWTPIHAEFGFGVREAAGRDPDSAPDPVTLDGRWMLRGVVDLIETRTEAAGGGELLVTDHKTGRDRTRDGMVVGGGELLQPVLYGLAVEQALGRPVEASRLSFCTLDGGFRTRVVDLGERERRQGVEVIEVIDRALEAGALLPAPRDGACRWCDFRDVCGPWEERRAARKDETRLADLRALRRMP